MFKHKRAMSEQGRIAARFSIMQAGIWIASAIGSYFTIFLRESGMSLSGIGMANAAFSAVAIFATTFWGMISDRVGSVKKIVIALLLVSYALSPLVPLWGDVAIGPIPLAVLVVVVMMFFRNPAMILADSWTVRGSYERGIKYGVVRSMGSLGYAIAAVSASFILPHTEIAYTFYIAPLLVAPVLILCLKIDDVGAPRAVPQATPKAEKPSVRLLLGNYYYVCYLLFYVGLAFALNGNFVFLPFVLENTGFEISRVGLIQGYRAMLEIPMLLLLAPLARRFPLHILIIASGVLFTVEAVLLGISVSLWQLLMFTTLFGLANGLLIAGHANYVYKLAPEGLKATAQTVIGSIQAVACILSNIFAGFMVEHIGIGRFFILLGVIIAGVTALYALSFPFGARILKLSKPDRSA